MRVVIQRVESASVRINKKVVSKISRGLLLLVAFEEADVLSDLEWMVKKIAGMRIFSDDNGKMNLSLPDVKGEFLVVSQFTLYASTKKGNRPSFIRSAKPGVAIPLYNKFVEMLKEKTLLTVKTGEFGADMKVSLVNDGPVTIVVDSKNRE